MNHGGLGVYESGYLSLPPELMEQAFVGRDGTMYGIFYPPRIGQPGYPAIGHHLDIMLTPIPYRFWPRTARLMIRMPHQPEMIHSISAFLESKGVSIVQAESTRSGYRYETWSFYLVFEDIDTLSFDNKRSVYIETHNKLSDLCNAIELECGPALFVEPNDIDLSSAVHPSYNTALAYFHNQVQEAHSSAGDDTWIREPFSMQCKGPGL